MAARAICLYAFGASLFVWGGLGDSVREPQWLWAGAGGASLALLHGFSIRAWRPRFSAALLSFSLWLAYLAWSAATSPLTAVLPIFAFPLLVLAGAHAVFRSRHRPSSKQFDRALLAATALQLLFGFLQVIERDPLFRRYELPGLPRHVPAGFMGQHTLYGFLLAWLAFYWGARGRWLTAAACVVACAASRSAFGAAALFYGALWLAYCRVPAKIPARAKLARIALVVAGGAVASAGAYFFITSESGRDFFYHNGRLQIWVYAVSAIRERPWLGYGVGAFATDFAAYNQPSFEILGDSKWREAHNELIEYVFNVGIGGLIAAFPLLLTLARAFWKKPPSFEKEIALGTLLMLGVNALGSFPLQIAPFATLGIYAMAWGLVSLRGEPAPAPS